MLEHGGGEFRIRLEGETIAIVDPRNMHYQRVLLSLQQQLVPVPFGVPMWAWPEIYRRWCMAWDLPEYGAARRLAYLVDHYRAALTNDLLVHAGLDLGEEWRERRWRRLLDVIDRLPGHSHFSAAISNDEEHAAMVAKAAAERGETKPGESKNDGPALTTWTPEVAVLTQVLDAVNRVAYTVAAVQAPKGKAGDPPKPAKRPVTALERAYRLAEHNRRQAAHESLVARVLPHKAAVKT